MREIKFRAWDICGQEMLHNKDVIFNELSPMQPNEYFIFEQYTEAKTIEGKEVYDGDILASEDGSLEPHAVYFDAEGGFWAIDSQVDLASIVNDEILQARIVGNIHENPELLE
jgi:hypothetical protein